MQNFSPYNYPWKLCTYSRATPPPCAFPSLCTNRRKPKDERKLKQSRESGKASVSGTDELAEKTNKGGKSGSSQTNVANGGRNKSDKEGSDGKDKVANSEIDNAKRGGGSRNDTRKRRPTTANKTRSKGKKDAQTYSGIGGLNKLDASTTTAIKTDEKGTFSTLQDGEKSDAFTNTQEEVKRLDAITCTPKNIDTSTCPTGCHVATELGAGESHFSTVYRHLAMQQYNQLLFNTFCNNFQLYNKECQALYSNNCRMQNRTPFAICNPQCFPNYITNTIMDRCPNRTEFCRQDCMPPDFGTACTNRTQTCRHVCMSSGPDLGTNSVRIALCAVNKCCDCGNESQEPSNVLCLKIP